MSEKEIKEFYDQFLPLPVLQYPDWYKKLIEKGSKERDSLSGVSYEVLNLQSNK